MQHSPRIIAARSLVRGHNRVRPLEQRDPPAAFRSADSRARVEGTTLATSGRSRSRAAPSTSPTSPWTDPARLARTRVPL